MLLYVLNLGNFSPEIYAEDCIFEDPTIRFSGKDLNMILFLHVTHKWHDFPLFF